MNFRIGEGWDIHALVADRKLIVGGVDIPFHLGLLGHSDADVLLHAITDALLGAAALGDIGSHFSDTDLQFKGADSGVLLAEVIRRVRAKGFEIGNVDSTVVAQAPKLMPYIQAMRQHIASFFKHRRGSDQCQSQDIRKNGTGWPWAGHGSTGGCVAI